MKVLIFAAVCFVLAVIPSAESREKARFYENVMNGETHQEGDEDWYV